MLYPVRAHRTAASVILEVVLTRPSIASVVVAARPDVRPAIANALWPRLQAAERGEGVWVRRSAPIAAWLDGAGRPIVSTTPPAPLPKHGARHEVVEEYLLAYATRAESRVGLELRVKLHREAHDAVLGLLGLSEKWQYHRALRASVCTRPFLREADRPTGWRRNHRDPLITETVAAVLEQLAVAAIVEVGGAPS